LPAGAGWKPALPDRRDACPTLRFMEVYLAGVVLAVWLCRPAAGQPFTN